MRISKWMKGLSLTFLLLLGQAAPAQFTEPTKEELAMTAYPGAPGAAAIILDNEERAIPDKCEYEEHVRIKVLLEKGRELATLSIPYRRGSEKPPEIQGRTIHADGTVIPLTVTPADLVAWQTKGYERHEMVVNLPSVDTGSILEYRVKTHENDAFCGPPIWHVQKWLFARHEHFFFHAGGDRGFEHMYYTAHLPANQAVTKDDHGNFELDVHDVQATPNEDWMPPLNTLVWRVAFYWDTSANGSGYWTTAVGSWGQAEETYIKPTGTLKRAAESLVAPGDSDLVKAQKIYAALMDFENTNFTRERSEAELKKEKLKVVVTAEDVWHERRGSSWQIVETYVALARSAGLKAWPMLVVGRDRAIFDPSVLSMAQFDDLLAIVSIDGKDVYLDPGQKVCPFGMMHWKHASAAGFRLVEKNGVENVRTPAIGYKSSQRTRVADLSVDASGQLDGVVRVVLTGQEALVWRQTALSLDKDSLKEIFNESIAKDLPAGVHAEFDHFIGVEDYEGNLIATLKVSGSVGMPAGKRMILPGLLMAQARHPFVSEEKRLTPIDVGYPRMEEDDMTYHLPAGYMVEGMPQATDLSWPSHAAFHVAVTDGGDTVHVVRRLAYNFTVLPSTEYAGLHGFFQKVATADQQSLVLARKVSIQGK